MAFQSTVNLYTGLGVIGEIILDGPTRAAPGVTKQGTAAAATDIQIGRAFTIDNSDGKYQPGGTGVFGGISVSPKAMSSSGTSAGGSLAPTMILTEGTVAEFMQMGKIVAYMANAANVGDLVQYQITTGTLKALPPVVTYTGVIAVTTGILTVSSASTGANLRVGSPVVGTGVPGGTFITALGTGTGGNGTYQTNIVTAVSSFTDGIAPNNPDTGYALVPNAKIERYTNAAAGLTVVSLTN